MNSRQMGRQPVDPIKLDVQGHGAKALEESLTSILSKLPIIIVSTHSQWELEGTRAWLGIFGNSVKSLQGYSMPWEALRAKVGILVPSDPLN
jgi:hypothetical protein